MTPHGTPLPLLLPPEEAEARSRMGTSLSRVPRERFGRPDWLGLSSSFLTLGFSRINPAQRKPYNAIQLNGRAWG